MDLDKLFADFEAIKTKASPKERLTCTMVVPPFLFAEAVRMSIVKEKYCPDDTIFWADAKGTIRCFKLVELESQRINPEEGD